MLSELLRFLNACADGDLAALRALMASTSLDVNATDAEGFTGLVRAVQNGRGNLIEELLAHGAVDVNRGEPFRWACELGHDGDRKGLARVITISKPLVLLLEVPNLDPNAKDELGRTAFFSACATAGSVGWSRFFFRAAGST